MYYALVGVSLFPLRYSFLWLQMCHYVWEGGAVGKKSYRLLCFRSRVVFPTLIKEHENMKNVLCVLLALGSLAFWRRRALGDWNPGDPYKWVQTPDLTATGVDVNCTTHSTFGPIRVVASDFPCTSTGPVDDFHIWGSWKNDLLPYGNAEAVTFRLSIYADVPADQQNFSHPLTQPVLWPGAGATPEVSIRRLRRT